MNIRLALFFMMMELCFINMAYTQPIPFKVIIKNKKIDLIHSKNNSDLNIANFKFYLSDFCFYKNDSIVDKESNSYHLIDLLDSNRSQLVLLRNNLNDYDKITFHLGIDSVTNVSGAYEGDLDPMNNMYWTWQSGYINLKFEGSIYDGVYREYHLGGYSFPNKALQSVSLYWNDSAPKIIYIHLDNFIHSIPDAIPFKWMTPDAKAVYLSHLFAKCLSSEK
ncbi:MAG: MbnP family protein [Bacteroidota bacterium]